MFHLLILCFYFTFCYLFLTIYLFFSHLRKCLFCSSLFQFFLRRQVTPLQFLGAFFIVVSIAVAKTPDIVQVMTSFLDVRTGKIRSFFIAVKYLVTKKENFTSEVCPNSNSPGVNPTKHFFFVNAIFSILSS